MIKITNLNKFYNKGRQNQIHAVNNTTLTLPDNGIVAFFGKSGCGKTTLLNIIGGLDRANYGSVSLDGETVNVNANEVKNKKIGYIFQNYNLSKQMTVYENVASSLRLCGVTDESVIETRVVSALKSVEMDKYRKRFPDELSGGQQQRVAIARAIVKNPDVILADEPTGNLDEHNTVMVMDLLKEISKEHLILLVTHEQNLVDLYCDEVIEIVDGVITERRENAETGGYIGKRVGDVYLGDMEMSSSNTDKVTLECYGEMGEGICLRLISVGGSLYLSAPEGVKIKFANSSSEIKIHEGKFEAHEVRSDIHLDENLSAPVKHGKCGRIYNFKKAWRSGISSVFGKKKVGKKMLIAALVCFSMVLVFITTMFGASIHTALNIKNNYNSDTVLVSASGMDQDEVLALLEGGYCDNFFAFGSSSGAVSSHSVYMTSVTFGLGQFETIGKSLGIEVQSHIFPMSALKDREVLAGKTEGISKQEVVISRGLADKMLDDNMYESVKDYEDLLNMSGYTQHYNTRLIKIAGVADGDDIAIYMDDDEYCTTILAHRFYSEFVSTADGTVITTSPSDKGVYLIVDPYEWNEYGNVKIPKIGTPIILYGETFTCEGVYDIDGGVLLNSMSQTSEGYTILQVENTENVDGFYINNVVVNNVGIKRLTYSYGDSDTLFSVAGGYIGHSDYDEVYFALHSEDVSGLIRHLKSEGYGEYLETPADFFWYYALWSGLGFITSSAALAVTAVMMCLCLYFIMRSSLMADVKQLGVFRAIGVRRRNIVYRYAVETAIVFASTIFVGWLVSGLIMSKLIAVMGTMATGVFYYPWWLAALSLVGLFIVSMLCGIIPVMLLLRKTPAEILSKYDI